MKMGWFFFFLMILRVINGDLLGLSGFHWWGLGARILWLDATWKNKSAPIMQQLVRVWNRRHSWSADIWHQWDFWLYSIAPVRPGAAVRWPEHMNGRTTVKLKPSQLRTEVCNTESKDEKSAVTVAAAGPPWMRMRMLFFSPASLPD